MSQLAAKRVTLPQVDEAPEVRSLWLAPAYFLASLLWLAAGAAGLVLLAPDLARGLVYHPRIFAVTHVVTLGVITSAIFGALHQFIPAVLGVAARSPRAGLVGFWCFQTGVVVLAHAFWHWSPAGQGAGWVLVIVGVGGASWNTLPARRHATRNRQVGTYVSLGHSALGLAMLLAAIRIGDGLGWWLTSREGLLAAHFHLGVLGFGTLTAVGFGSKMLPAFLGTGKAPTGPLKWIGWVVGAGLVLFSFGAVWDIAALYRLGGGLMALGVGTHLVLLGHYFARRTRPLDAGLGFVLLAAVCYAAALLIGIGLLLARPRPGAGWAAYAVLGLLGWLGLLIIGVMHRVVPRVLTLIRVRRGGALTPVHQRVELLAVPLAWTSLILIGSGTVGLAGAVGLGLPGAARGASVALLAGSVCLLVQAARLVRGALGRSAGSTPL